jgi:hypothetical protein
VTVTDFARLFRTRWEPEREFAALYLESRGLILGTDFGYSNCIPMATCEILKELEENGSGLGAGH